MIAIVDYKAGNLTSVLLALQALEIEAEITQDPERILAADRVIFPGVGAAGDAMQHLHELKLAGVLRQVVEAGTPFLGICLGTQIIFDHSDEDGGVDCVGLLPGNVVRFQPSNKYEKIPQIGWNAVQVVREHPVMAGIEQESEFYFVHSYYPAPADDSLVIGRTGYADVQFAAVVGRDNLVATQFHPERSGRIGLQLLENFTRWDGSC